MPALFFTGLIIWALHISNREGYEQGRQAGYQEALGNAELIALLKDD